MNITINFILLFLIIILPGIVFRRMYFYGDFSKQFRIKEPLHHLFISNIIPGVLLFLLSLLILIYFDFILPLGDLSPQFLLSIRDFYVSDEFLIEISKIAGVTFLFSFLGGYISSRLIRALRLDLRFKLLRYRNMWFYLFSGEISNFEKFKINLPLREEIKKRKKFYPPLVDILIEQGSEKILYSGILLDYEVSPDDLLRLERVYLKDTQRYKKVNKKKMRVDIPGDLFILDTRHLINININYPKISSFDLQQKAIIKRRKNQKLVASLYVLTSLLTLVIFLVYIFSLFTDIGFAFYDSHKWYGKTLLLLLIVQVVSLFLPTRNNTGTEGGIKYEWKMKSILFSIMWATILGLLYWILYRPF